MRTVAALLTVVCLAGFCPSYAAAQSAAYGQADEQIPPYHTHSDRRHGHDHVYPDRGAVVRDLPRGSIIVNYAGFTYRFAGGVWYERHGPAYIVVAPPIGLVVPSLPAFATRFDSHHGSYLYANDTFYRARPDLGGYEVVNDPADSEPGSPKAAASESHPESHPDAHPESHPDARADARAVAAPLADGSVASLAAAIGSTPSPSVVAPAGAASSDGPPALHTAQAQQRIAPVPATPPAPPSAMAPATLPATPPAIPPSSASPPPSAMPATLTRLAVSPRNGQSPDVEARDRYECYRFAVAQSGFDPLDAGDGRAAAGAGQRQADYGRAQAACLEGRGYSLR